VKRLSLGLWLVAVLGGVACSTDALIVSEVDAVVTVADPGRNFSQYETFALTSEVSDLCYLASELGLGGAGGALSELPSILGGAGGAGGEGSDPCLSLDHSADAALQKAVSGQLKELGYRQVELGSKPDLVVTLGAVARGNWFYDPAFAWCDSDLGLPCWVPKESYPYSFPYGSVLVALVDPDESTSTKRSVVWFAALTSGYALEGNVTDQTALTIALAQAISQTPQLKP
jgi:Domain of unknown function (DUF4136)